MTAAPIGAHNGISTSSLNSWYVIAIPIALAIFGMIWLTWPVFNLTGAKGVARIEFVHRRYETRRDNFSALVALVAYYVPGLWITVSIHGGWDAVGEYLRAHLLDGFGCAAFFAMGWRQLDRHTGKALLWFDIATAGIAAASTYIAGGNAHVVIVVGLVAFVLANLMWKVVARFSARVDDHVKLCLDEATRAEPNAESGRPPES